MVARSAFERFIGTTLGSYYLEQLLGLNELGPVFLGSANPGSKYLVRLVNAPATLEPEARLIYLGRFQQLANSITELQHRHILPLLDYGNYQGMPYLVTPNLPMQTLISAIAKKGAFELPVVMSYLEELCKALTYAHEQGVIHRNLSTDCVFILRDGRLVIGDFGVMRMLELARQDGQAYPNYGSGEGRAPEQIMGRAIDTYTDIYALGALIYRLLTGHSVFKANTREEVAQMHLYQPVPSLNKWRAGDLAALDAVLSQAMAKDPLRRFQHPLEFAQAFQQAIPQTAIKPPEQRINRLPLPEATGVPVNQLVFIQPKPSDVKGPRQGISRRQALWLVGGGGGLVVVGGLATLAYTLRNSASATPQGTIPANAPTTAATQSASKGPIIARVSDIPLDSAKTFPLSGDASRNPGIIVHLPDNRFVAFDSTCTHAGCAVQYESDRHLLHCPCHDALFDPSKQASVVQGPAVTPLAPIAINVNADGTITSG